MKRLLQSVLVCLLVVALAPTASLGQSEAQDGAQAAGEAATKPAGKKSRSGGMAAELGLDDEQVKKMHAINKTYAAQMKNIRTSSKKSPERTRQLKETALKRTAEIKALLTPEQFDKYEKRKAARSKKPQAQ